MANHGKMDSETETRFDKGVYGRLVLFGGGRGEGGGCYVEAPKP